MSLHLMTWLRGLLQGPGPHRLEEFGVQELLSMADLEEALARSEQEPVLLFKHSTTCPISASAYRRLTEYLANTPDAPACYLVKVIESRPISNEIAARLHVIHQSPQILLVRNRNSDWNASHGAISGTAIAAAIRQ